MVLELSLQTSSVQGSSLKQLTQRINSITDKSSMTTCQEKIIQSSLQIETSKITLASLFTQIFKSLKWIFLMKISSVYWLKERMILLVWLLRKWKYYWMENRLKSKILKLTVICILIVMKMRRTLRLLRRNRKDGTLLQALVMVSFSKFLL